MNRKFAFRTALVAGLLPVAAFAQVSPAPPAESAAPAQPTLPTPQAFPAKIALINFDDAVMGTNEGQRALQAVRDKYQPQKDSIDKLGAEIESLQKQANAGKATMSAGDYQARLQNINAKEKQLQQDTEDAQNAYTADAQDSYGKIAPKVEAVMKKYVADNGYTILFNYGTQEPIVMWVTENPNQNITLAVIQAYNATTPTIGPPMPSAPSAPSAAHKPAASTTPRATPKPATTTK